MRELLLALLLTGCGGTQFINVPVPTKSHPPADLVEPLSQSDRPVFVSPGAPGASSCLTPEGEDRLRGMVLELMGKYEALRAWATE